MANPGPKPVGAEERKTGQYLRKARLAAGYSQEQLAEKLDVSFQQIQNYESGKSRIPFYRLVIAARVLDVPLDYFERGPAAQIEAHLPSMTGTLKMTPSLRKRIEKIARENWPNVPDAAQKIVSSIEGKRFHLTMKED